MSRLLFALIKQRKFNFVWQILAMVSAWVQTILSQRIGRNVASE